MRWLVDLARRLIPADWRAPVVRDLEEEASARGRGPGWVSSQAGLIGVRLRLAATRSSVMSDFRFAFRQLRRAPAFTAAAILTLALGIGLNVSVFAVADGILLKPLPYRDPDRLVVIHGWDVQAGRAHLLVPANVAAAAAAGTSTIESAGLTVRTGRTIGPFAPGGDPLSAMEISTTGLDVLGIRAVEGRGFQPGDESARPRPVMLAFATWQSHFAGDRAAIGRVMAAGKESFLVIGVLPPFLPLPGTSFVTGYQILLPVAPPGTPGQNALAPFARLRRGATIAAASQELREINERTQSSDPRERGDIRISALQFGVNEARRPAVITLVTVASLVLLIATANLANLFLSRGAARRSEFVLRTALGASRVRLARALAVEAAIVTAGAALVAVLVSMALHRALYDAIPVDYKVFMSSTLEWRPIAFALLATAGALAVFALVTVIQASRTDLRPVLDRSRRGAGEPGLAVRAGQMLLLAQAAMATLVVTGALFMVSSFARLVAVDLGFEPEGLYQTVPVRRIPGETPADRRARFQAAENLLAAIPGVTAGSADSLPWTGETPYRPMHSDRTIRGGLYQATRGFFTAAQIRLVEGRLPSEDEFRRLAPVAVVNRRAAAVLWPGQSAIGRRHEVPGGQRHEVVGIVDDVRPRHGAPGGAAFYIPMDYGAPGNPRFVLRSTLTVEQLRRRLGDVARAIDPSAPDIRVAPASASVDPWLMLPRLIAGLFGIFAFTALLVSAVGIVGLLLYVVQQRRFEIGVRMALGASAGAVRRMIVWRALAPVTAGVAGGVAAAWWAVRFVESLLFEVQSHDWRIYAAGAASLITLAVFAAYLPARHASRIDPLIVLRNE